MKRAQLKYNILELLKSSSKDSPIYSKNIENLLSVSGPSVRDVIRELRRDGAPIAESSNGYYYARTFEQIKDTIYDLEGRAKSMLTTATALRKTFNESIQYSLWLNEEKTGL